MSENSTIAAERSPGRRLVLFALYFVAVLQALWQHGHPEFTVAIISLAALAPLINTLPHSLLTNKHGRTAQGVIAVVGVLWMGWRYSQKTPTDLALIEGLACISLSFAFTRKSEEFEYLLLTAVIMIGYGAVAPARHLFVGLLPISVPLIFVALYQSRLGALGRRAFTDNPQHLARNWQALAIHLGGFVLLWALLFVLFPVTGRTGPGVVGVSYETNSANLLAPHLQQWLPAGQIASDPGGPFSMTGEQAHAHDPNAETLVQGDWQQATGNGPGSGTPSDDIVMRVQSPVRLYWVGHIYDHYDGLKWHRAKPPAKSKKTSSRSPTVIPQTFVIDKWVSRSLFAAYRPVAFRLPRHLGHQSPLEKYEWGHRFAEQQSLPTPPFQYSVHSHVHSLPSATRDSWPAGDASAPRRRHPSRRLPKAVPARVRQLALEIIGDRQDPMAKAIALRDHLRNTYTYQQYSAKTPPDHEPVDYFLFNLDSGHCEYFAAALAVLARAVDLPARVATGFTPGDYNALTGCFEVKESHAHAWTQIYVPGHRWLTFDATPPGVVESRVTPRIIGAIRDPFTDDWQVTPPELSRDVTDYRERTIGQSSIPAASDTTAALPKIGLLARISMNIPTNISEAKSIWRRWTRQTTDADGERSTRLSRSLDTVTANLKAMLSRIVELAHKTIEMATPRRLLGALVFIIVALGVLYGGRRLHAVMSRRRRLNRCHDWWSRASHLRDTDPSASIRYSYRMVRELLALAGNPKAVGEDLFDYGRDLNQQMPFVAHDSLAVFDLFSLSRYSGRPATSREARAALMRASCARDHLLEKINE